jgi:IS5 family transposase
MRKMTRAIFEEFWASSDGQASNNDPVSRDIRLPNIVIQHQEQFKRLGDLLARQPEILAAVHHDLQAVLESQNKCKSKDKKDKRHREADFTTENLFRAILVMQIEGWTFRDTTIRIAESETLQNFCRLFKKSTIDFTLICKAFGAIQPGTWENINRLFAIRMMHEKKIEPDNIRTDTTVTECNIHYPTDSSLLWDCYRVLERNITKVREITSQIDLSMIRFHIKKIKKLHLDITRFSNSKKPKRQRQVQRWKKTLTQRVKQTVNKISEITKLLLTSPSIMVYAIGVELNAMLPVMAQVVHVAERNLEGEKVPANEKVFSIFEPHTELIMRGKRDKPVEFGHKILLSECPQKFITDWHVFEQCPADPTLLPIVLERHEEIYGKKPKTLATDKGFCPEADELEALREELSDEVEYLAVPKRLRDLGDAMMSEYQKFRAGIEGTISCLKRAFRLARCCFRGFKNFCSAVGSAVFCHNLIVIVRQEESG